MSTAAEPRQSPRGGKWARVFLAALSSLPMSDVGVSAEPEAYSVVVNSTNPLSSVSRKVLSAMFLRKTLEWSNGVKVSPVDQKESSAVRESFSAAVHDRHTSAIKSYWLQMIFSGRSVPPPETTTGGEVLAFVRSHPGGVGYVLATEASAEGVKVLKVVD
jgi:ABC-type phosphate transport system substrate-binding protein